MLNYYHAAGGDAGLSLDVDIPFVQTSGDDACADGEIIDTNCGDATAAVSGTLTIDKDDAGSTVTVTDATDNLVIVTDASLSGPVDAYLTDSISRDIGKALYLTHNLTAVGTGFGLTGNVNPSVASAHEPGVRIFAATPSLRVISYGSGTTADWTQDMEISKEVKFAFVLGGWSEDGNNTPWNTGDTDADFQDGHALFVKGYTAAANWTMISRGPTGTTDTLYGFIDQYPFVSATSAVDSIKVATLSSSVFTGNVLDQFVGSDNDQLSANVPEQDDEGAGWLEWDGDWQINASNQVVQEVTSGSGRAAAVIDLGSSDYVVNARITTSSGGRSSNGFWLRHDGEANATMDTYLCSFDTGGSENIYEFTNGSYVAARATTAAAQSTSETLTGEGYVFDNTIGCVWDGTNTARLFYGSDTLKTSNTYAGMFHDIAAGFYNYGEWDYFVGHVAADASFETILGDFE